MRHHSCRPAPSPAVFHHSCHRLPAINIHVSSCRACRPVPSRDLGSYPAGPRAPGRLGTLGLYSRSAATPDGAPVLGRIFSYKCLIDGISDLYLKSSHKTEYFDITLASPYIHSRTRLYRFEPVFGEITRLIFGGTHLPGTLRIYFAFSCRFNRLYSNISSADLLLAAFSISKHGLW